MERLAGESHSRLRYFCSPQHADSAFYPIINQMERAAGLAHDDTPQAKLDKGDLGVVRQERIGFSTWVVPMDPRYPRQSSLGGLLLFGDATVPYDGSNNSYNNIGVSTVVESWFLRTRVNVPPMILSFTT
jgi:hypothetical protein